MRLVDLSVLYLAVGVACAVALYRRAPGGGAPRLVNALTAIPLWPLWAPIAWTSRSEPSAPGQPAHDQVAAIGATLEEAVASVAGTPLEALLTRDSARTLLGEVERVSGRNQELLLLLSREDFSLEAAERKLAALELRQATARARASARLHLENIRRLHALAERDLRALEELRALTTALRTQLVLVRLSGSSAEGVNDIVSELWAHVEGLKQASDEVYPPGAGAPRDPEDTETAHLETPARA